ANKRERGKYEALKTELAEKYRDDREAYTDAKGEFVRKIVRKALGPDFKFEI
ncbi:MAG: GrpB family protein, partial [Candidatus Levybacteria bacterium]|nr:GrpB family protein [Candidatus Levybacteria bacterium]